MHLRTWPCEVSIAHFPKGNQIIQNDCYRLAASWLSLQTE